MWFVLLAQVVITSLTVKPTEGITYVPIELGDNPATREWLAYDGQRYQVVVERQGQLCTGPWFNPLDSVFILEPSFAGWFFSNGAPRFVVQGPRYYQEVGLDMPSCP